jgi:rod shape-determining protein MreD
MDRTITPYGDLTRVARFAVLLITIIVIQGILTRYFQVFEYFDLPLIYSIYYGFTQANLGGSIAVGSVLGLLQDSLSGAALGTNGFSKTLIAFFAASAGSKFDVDQSVTRVLALVLFTFLDAVLKVIIGSIAQPDGVSLYGMTPGVWTLSAAFNVLCGMILFGYRSRFGNATA